MEISSEQRDRLLALVRRKYPDWSGFDHAGFVEDEIDYKQAIAQRARELLGEATFRQLLQEDRADEIISRLETVGRSTNLLWQRVPMEGDLNVLYKPDLDRRAFCERMADLLYGEGDSPERLDRYLAYVEASNLPNKWTFPTYFLFFCHPESEILVKPGATGRFLRLLGLDHRLGPPSGPTYARVRAVASALLAALVPAGARDMIDVQSLIWICAEEDRARLLRADQADAFEDFVQQFVEEYVASPAGREHAALYRTSSEAARRNYDAITEARQRGEDVTDRVLLQLLPHTDTQPHRQSGAWISVAPTITARVQGWFEGVGWAKPDDWPHAAAAILSFIQTCTENPERLDEACATFAASPYSKGFQAGMLTPVLHALRPKAYLILNEKPRTVLAHFTGSSLSTRIADYPQANRIGLAFVEEVAPLLHRFKVPEVDDIELFDMFCHWLVAVRRFDFPEVRYWKIAPGEDAWQWQECLEGGFIAIGWEEFGDLSGLSRPQFADKQKQLMAQHGWTSNATNQVWQFARGIAEGHRVVANRGTSEVVGIGTVTGPYYFVPGVRHGHRLPVAWDDTTPRRVDQPGWKRTLVRLEKDTFDAILRAEPLPPTNLPPPAPPGETDVDRHPDCPFTHDTFRLLAALNETPIRAFYLAHKDDFRTHVEAPFRALMRSVAERLPPAITQRLETKDGIIARILKNDFGQGGAWDFLWGAFYPKGGKRIRDAQLFLVVERDVLDYGFYIGRYGSDQRERFVHNARTHHEALTHLLKDSLSGPDLSFGERLEDNRMPAPGPADRWKEWLHAPAGDIRAGKSIPAPAVLGLSAEALANEIASTFERLFPLILLATTPDPLAHINDYLDVEEGTTEVRAAYTLEQCAADTGFSTAELERWLRALERKKQAILYGPPGTGKTFLAKHLARHLVSESDGLVEIVQFHPAYSYEDFIQGIRPAPRPDGGLAYPLVPGRLLTFCREAGKRTGPCVLIIDEINRANLSQVFGELMYLLEYRDEEIALAAGERFKIPANARLLGTMNTADRPIALVDHALRRRFAFISLQPRYDLLQAYHERLGRPVDGLVQTLKRLNAQIGDRHYEVGVSFFLCPDLDRHLEDIWRMEIEPYVEEYFFDQPEKAGAFRWEAVRQGLLT